MKKNIYLIVLLTFLSGCALSPKKMDKKRIEKIKKIAIVGFYVDQESTGGVMRDGNLAKKAISSHLLGGFNHEGQVIFGDYAVEIYKKARLSLIKNMRWKSISIPIIKKNRFYQNIENKLSKDFLNGKAGAKKGYLRYGLKDFIFAQQLYNKSPKYEKIKMDLVRKLDVDAIALLGVTIKTPTDGIGLRIGSLIRAQSGDYKPEIDIGFSIYDKEGYVGKLNDKKKSDKTYAKHNLKKGFVQLFDKTFNNKLKQINTLIK